MDTGCANRVRTRRQPADHNRCGAAPNAWSGSPGPAGQCGKRAGDHLAAREAADVSVGARRTLAPRCPVGPAVSIGLLQIAPCSGKKTLYLGASVHLCEVECLRATRPPGHSGGDVHLLPMTRWDLFIPHRRDGDECVRNSQPGGLLSLRARENSPRPGRGASETLSGGRAPAFPFSRVAKKNNSRYLVANVLVNGPRRTAVVSQPFGSGPPKAASAISS